MAWGYHLTIDAYDCDAKSISDQFNIKQFVEVLVPKINMKAFGGPLIIKFGSGAAQGYTLVQLIETSNITAHFAEEDNSMYFDLFSCKEFDKDLVTNLVRQYFKPQEVVVNLVERGNRGAPVLATLDATTDTDTQASTKTSTKKKSVT